MNGSTLCCAMGAEAGAGRRARKRLKIFSSGEGHAAAEEIRDPIATRLCARIVRCCLVEQEETEWREKSSEERAERGNSGNGNQTI